MSQEISDFKYHTLKIFVFILPAGGSKSLKLEVIIEGSNVKQTPDKMTTVTALAGAARGVGDAGRCSGALEDTPCFVFIYF